MTSHSSTGTPERRRRGLLSRLVKPGTASVLGTVALAMIATLVSPLGAQSASAADGNPTFWIGHGTPDQARNDYWGMINGVRAAVDEGRNRSVPDTNVPVDHTNPGNQYYLQVDIHAWDNVPDHYVRINIRRADLYVVGWWSADNYYNRIGDDPAPTARWQDGEFRGVNGQRTASFGGDYPSLQNVSGASRFGMHFNNGALNDGVWALLNAHEYRREESDAARGQHTRDQALAIMRFAQFISEATRFRAFSDFMVTAVRGGDLVLDNRIVALTNDWDPLSGRFNQLRNQRNSDAHPFQVWGRNEQGGLTLYTLWTAALYANYVLNTAKGG